MVKWILGIIVYKIHHYFPQTRRKVQAGPVSGTQERQEVLKASIKCEIIFTGKFSKIPCSKKQKSQGFLIFCLRNFKIKREVKKSNSSLTLLYYRQQWFQIILNIKYQNKSQIVTSTDKKFQAGPCQYLLLVLLYRLIICPINIILNDRPHQLSKVDNLEATLFSGFNMLSSTGSSMVESEHLSRDIKIFGSSNICPCSSSAWSGQSHCYCHQAHRQSCPRDQRFFSLKG